jgi:tetratricopeptide (TPR) repeat protein
MNSVRKPAALLAVLLLVAVTAAAQRGVSGQFLLPNGDLPHSPIRFYLTSDDGQVNEYRFSDSNGRFILERVGSGTAIGYTITVASDGSSYDTTSYNFVPAYERSLRITLRPLTSKTIPTGATVSATAVYKPKREAAELHAAALKEIKQNQFDAAEKHLRKAIDLDAKFSRPFNDLGVLLMQQKKYAEAEKILRQGLAADPKSIHAFLNLGITLNHRKKYADAIAVLGEALRLELGLVSAHLHLGIALVQTAQFEEAEKALTRVLKTPGPEEIPAQLYLGKLYAATGKLENAVAAFETYLQKAPNAGNASDVRAVIEQIKRELAARP